MVGKIVIMAGGTGGHIFPALAVALHLREQGWQVSWIGTEKGLEHRIVPENGIELDLLSVNGLRAKGLLAKLKAPVMLLLAAFQAMKILRKRQADVVLGMGGFVAGPGGLMAKLLGIPLVIHEQNRIPGTTNRYLAKFTTLILEAFPHSFPAKVKAICTGNPLRKQFNDLESPSKHKPLRLLVVGGSLGAQILNEVVPKAVAQCDNIEIKHQTGKTLFDEVTKSYQQLNVNAQVMAFIEDMVAAYQWADLVVCRAGAMTISELAAMGLPAVLIPYPYAIDDHQTANAQYLVEANAAVMIAQQDLTVETLLESIQFIEKNQAQMRIAAKSCARLEATELDANFCIQAAKL